MGYEVTILQDSLHPENDDSRLTTFEVTFPRFILAEVNTHRMLSRNSGSSRAIPTERFIEALLSEPFVPIFNERVKGMGVGALLSDDLQDEVQAIWLEARDAAIKAATELMVIGIDKSRANRLLEPFMWHTAIISATEWGNFFALRTDEGAQPEFRIIAQMMLNALNENTPTTLTYNDWHTPLIEGRDFLHYGREGGTKFPGYRGDWDSLKDISAGRLARRSSYNRHDPEPDENSIARTETLTGSGHWSPLEHIARPVVSGRTLHRDIPDDWSGNFFGWHQYRKDFKFENDFSLKAKALA